MSVVKSPIILWERRCSGDKNPLIKVWVMVLSAGDEGTREKEGMKEMRAESLNFCIILYIFLL